MWAKNCKLFIKKKKVNLFFIKVCVRCEEINISGSCIFFKKKFFFSFFKNFSNFFFFLFLKIFQIFFKRENYSIPLEKNGYLKCLIYMG